MNSPAKFTPLRSLSDALAELLAHALPLEGSEAVATFDADRRVLAHDVVSQLNVPGFDNSAMDGYALRSADAREAGAVLQVTQRIAAGHFGVALQAGQTARIFTGAPVPQGANCVVMQEDTTDVGDGKVQVNTVPKAGQWIRRAGEDIKKSAIVLLKGELLTPASIGLAASIGLKTLQVKRRPRVALFSTGDELVMPGDVAPQDMPPGAIYNSNRFFLRALLHRLGCEVSDLGIVPDNRDLTLAALKTAADHHDLILTSGGVSVGEEDHIKPAVQQLGALDLWSIAIKPGKPFAYGHIKKSVRPELVEGLADKTHFIGLPGNPVSSFITFVLLVRPFIQKLQGQRIFAINSIAAYAHFDWPKADKRQEFLRVKRNAAGGLSLFANQSSGVLTSAVWADGVVDNPAGKTIAHGDVVRFIPFTELL
jgi:molybdopterin molybdotransferase